MRYIEKMNYDVYQDLTTMARIESLGVLAMEQARLEGEGWVLVGRGHLDRMGLSLNPDYLQK